MVDDRLSPVQKPLRDVCTPCDFVTFSRRFLKVSMLLQYKWALKGWWFNLDLEMWNWHSLWRLAAASSVDCKALRTAPFGHSESTGENAINYTLCNEKAPSQLLFVSPGRINTQHQSQRAWRLLDSVLCSASQTFVKSNYPSFHFNHTRQTQSGWSSSSSTPTQTQHKCERTPLQSIPLMPKACLKSSGQAWAIWKVPWDDFCYDLVLYK